MCLLWWRPWEASKNLSLRETGKVQILLWAHFSYLAYDLSFTSQLWVSELKPIPLTSHMCCQGNASRQSSLIINSSLDAVNGRRENCLFNISFLPFNILMRGNTFWNPLNFINWKMSSWAQRNNQGLRPWERLHRCEVPHWKSLFWGK